MNVIEECKRQGVVIAIATARSEKEAERYIDLIKPDIVISNGGALVKYKEDIVFESMLSASISDELIRDCILNPNVGEITVATESAYYWNRHDLSEFGNDYSHAIYNDFTKPLNCPTYKITVEIFEENAADELAAKYPQCDFIHFSGEEWYRFAHKNATKGYAISKLLQYLHIGFDEVAAFGDDYNDVDIPLNSIVYCDIPYKNTKQYETSKNFDYERFYEWCRKNKGNYKIFISEYSMPSDFICVWQKEITNAMNQTKTYKPIERLYTI